MTNVEHYLQWIFGLYAQASVHGHFWNAVYIFGCFAYLALWSSDFESLYFAHFSAFAKSVALSQTEFQKWTKFLHIEEILWTWEVIIILILYDQHLSSRYRALHFSPSALVVWLPWLFPGYKKCLYILRFSGFHYLAAQLTEKLNLIEGRSICQCSIPCQSTACSSCNKGKAFWPFLIHSV